MCQEKDFGAHSWCGSFPFERFIPHMMRKFAHHMEECVGKAGSWIPYNLEDREDGYFITIPLPGRNKEDVNVTLIGNNLNIKASIPKVNEETKEKPKEAANPFLRYFFTFIDVDMDIPLPPNADLESIKSIMANGLLRVKIGKKPSKTINVNEGGIT